MARESNTVKTAKAAFSKSVSCTSMLLNSTRHPMGELAGGGLKRRVCQLVDCMFYRRILISKKKCSNKTHLKVIHARRVILINSLRKHDQGISYEQMRHMF